MCGIVGWLTTEPSRVVDPALLARMRDAIAHRGPDGAGLWLSSENRVGLGFRRLAIVDLSPSANQPMPNEDGSVQVVFNGEIYNHRTLRAELEGRGHRFRTDHSDTETIVHGYEEWGEGVVERLDGKFAIAVWDGPRQRLFLARDRVGVKPLYFAWVPSGFLFASEIKALALHPGLSRDVEPLAVYHYLSFLTTPAPLTMFRGVYKLPAGWRGFVTLGGGLQAEPYWDALPGRGEDAAEVARLSGAALRDFAARRGRELLEEAVVKRLMSDVPFGVLLSGGIDSSANVALMSRHMDRPVRTFTVGFSDHTHLNELDWARRVARHFKTDHHEVMVDERAMQDYLPALVHSQDEPIADWVCIPLYFVSKLARDSGTVVVQVGEGSDEQFCGYASYMAYLDAHRRYWRPFAWLPAAARTACAALADGALSLTERYDRHLDLVSRAGRGRELFWSGAHVFPEGRKLRLLDVERIEPLAPPPELLASGLLPAGFARRDTFEVVRSFYERLDQAAPGRDVLTRMTYAEFKLRLPELLLMRVDKVGMSVSIEPRVPFLDHRLVEFTMNLPQEVKVEGRAAKALLKRAVRGLLPDDVIDRPKMGFGAPMVQWLRGDFGRAVEAEIAASRFFERFPARRGAVLDMVRRHRQGRADLALYVWTLYNAVAWFDHWIERPGAARVA
ncbi:MAG TPA: asparagine synthase (glutamine-hydrolyzing) [Vicinamibacteria bacterium]|nr:asparagine synthase (glutamine-hydrolyzing) [Vicinamibacteria bacterium]